MLKQLLTFFCFIIIPTFSFAQLNFKPGYVVTPQGDTLTGFINYREWTYNPTDIKFKSQLSDANTQDFTSKNVQYVNIKGYEAYESFSVGISQDEVNLARAAEKPDTTKITDTVLLKVILRGDKVNLYSYKDKIKNRFYVLNKQEAAPIELGYRVQLINSQVTTLPIYQHQLSAIAVKLNNFTLNRQIQSSKYSKSDLVNIIKLLNINIESNISVSLNKNPKSRFFIGAGLNLTTFNFSGENDITIDRLGSAGFYIHKDQIVNRTYMPKISVGIDVFPNPAIQRLVLRGELLLAPTKSKVVTLYKYNDHTDNQTADRFQQNTYNLNRTSVSIAPQVIYNVYNKENIKFYFGAGAAFNYHLIHKNQLYLKTLNKGTIEAEQNLKDYFKMRDFNLNLIIRSGIVLNKKMDVSVVYFSPTELLDYLGYSSIKTSSFQVSANYLFNKSYQH